MSYKIIPCIDCFCELDYMGKDNNTTYYECPICGKDHTLIEDEGLLIVEVKESQKIFE